MAGSVEPAGLAFMMELPVQDLNIQICIIRISFGILNEFTTVELHV
jgi:hypothetical protein